MRIKKIMIGYCLGLAIAVTALTPVLVPLVAHAQDVVATPAPTNSTVVSAQPLVSLITPYLSDVLGVVITAAITWAAAMFAKLTGINISTKNREALHSAAMTGVSFALQRANTVAADFKFDTHSTIIKDATDWVYQSVPDAVKKLGADPDTIKKLVESKIKLLAETGVTPTPTVEPLGLTAGAVTATKA